MNLKENMTVIGEGVVTFLDHFEFDNGDKKLNFQINYEVWGKGTSLQQCVLRCEVYKDLLPEVEPLVIKGERVRIEGQLVIDDKKDKNSGFFPKVRIRKVYLLNSDKLD